MYPQPITPNNKLPDEYRFDDLLAIMRDRNQWRVKAGANTYAALVERNGEEFIEVIHYTACVARLRESGAVSLYSCDLYTAQIADRMTRAVRPLGYEVQLAPNGSKLYVIRHVESGTAWTFHSMFTTN